MSFSWTYLTRRFLLQNYRDYVAVGIIGSYIAAHSIRAVTGNDDNNWARQRVYTHDESDIAYREVTNRTDGAVKREHAIRFSERIKKMRAENERRMALDAYNHLNKRSHSV
jgi:hypothetical protein